MDRAIKTIVLVVLVAIIGILGFIVVKGGMLTGGKSQQAEAKEMTYSLGEFTVNLNEPGYKRYIKVKISVGYTTKKLDTELGEDTSSISDAINGILRSKKLDDVNSPEKTDLVKKEIKDKINGILKTGKITNVYFDQILIQ